MNDDAQWQNNRNQHGGANYRKQGGQSYNDNKGKNYSPSASYNYTKGGRQGQNYQQHPRRRIDRYKRESYNTNERLIKQNDMIIKILKEIRDKLVGADQTLPETEQVKVPENDHKEETSENVSLSEEHALQEDEEQEKTEAQDTASGDVVATVSEPDGESNDADSQEISSN